MHDGYGIRTTVFVLGCPLSCRWCQNPENLQASPGLMFNRHNCIGCGDCIKICPQKAIYVDENGNIQTDRKKCNVCGKCIDSCCTQARQLSGRSYTVDEVYKEVSKDKVVFSETSGGITLSGGEFSIFPEFVYELFRKCKADNIHTAIETCGYTKWENIEMFESLTNLFLYDIKLITPERHKKWTGVDNSLIIDNIRKLSQIGKNIIVRVPLIPGVNDDEEEFVKIVEFVKSLKSIKVMHILPFHQMGSLKYELLGNKYSLEDVKEQNDKNIEKCRLIAEKSGLCVDMGGLGFTSNSCKDKKKSENSFFIYNF